MISEKQLEKRLEIAIAPFYSALLAEYNVETPLEAEVACRLEWDTHKRPWVSLRVYPKGYTDGYEGSMLGKIFARRRNWTGELRKLGRNLHYVGISAFPDEGWLEIKTGHTRFFHFKAPSLDRVLEGQELTKKLDAIEDSRRQIHKENIRRYKQFRSFFRRMVWERRNEIIANSPDLYRIDLLFVPGMIRLLGRGAQRQLLFSTAWYNKDTLEQVRERYEDLDDRGPIPEVLEVMAELIGSMKVGGMKPIADRRMGSTSYIFQSETARRRTGENEPATQQQPANTGSQESDEYPF